METPMSSYPQRSLSITSPHFAHGEHIPVKYTCDGANTNPPLSFAGIPDETQALVLIVEDPDVPKYVRSDGIWDHWVVCNISADTQEVKAGQAPESATQGTTTNGTVQYAGPCPPDGEHRYYFRLLALDKTLSLKEGASKGEVIEASDGYVLDSAELMGRYER